jgi:hypothetical protein
MIKQKQRILAITVFSTAFILFISVTAYAQLSSVYSVYLSSDTLKAGSVESDGNERILSSAADPHVFNDSYREAYRVQNGFFFGNRQIGFESTYRHSDSDYYISLMGVLLEKKPMASGANPSYLMGGFSLGREILLNGERGYLDETGTEFYFRVGPGIGIAARGYFDGEEMRTYMGLFSSATLGAQFHLSKRVAFFLHGGGQVVWFPALREIGFLGAPVAGLGFQFSFTPGIQPVSY